MKLLTPRTSEGFLPYIVLDWAIRFGFWLQYPSKIKHLGGRWPFGLFIRVPFLRLRWGCA